MKKIKQIDKNMISTNYNKANRILKSRLFRKIFAVTKKTAQTILMKFCSSGKNHRKIDFANFSRSEWENISFNFQSSLISVSEIS